MTAKYPLRRINILIVALLLCWCGHAASTAAATSPKSTATRASATKEKSVSTELKQPPKWLEVCNQLAPCTNILCSLAPLSTILHVSKTKSVGSLPLLPYSSMIANGFVWALYGHLAHLPNVKYANMIGIILGSYYFKEWTGAAAASVSGAILYHKLAITWIVLINSFVAARLPRKVATEIVGKEGVFVFILLFASPLSALKEIIASKSAAAIPLPFTVASTINCSLWSVTGLLLMKDFNIYFPSILGLFCAMIQLFLKGIYGDGFGSMKTLNSIVEMGHVA